MRPILFAFFGLLSIGGMGQLDSVYAEVFYQDDGTLPGYPCGFTTYRIYAALSSPDLELSSVHSDDNVGADLFIGTYGGHIWNSGFGGVMASNINADFWEMFPFCVYDSFVTIQRTHEDDNGDQLIANMNSYEYDHLESVFGIPPGTQLDSLGYFSSYGEDLLFEETAGWQSIDGIGAPSNDGPILLAQVTTNAPLHWRLNVVVREAMGSGWGEIFHGFHHAHDDPNGEGNYGETKGLVGTIYDEVICGFYPQCYLPQDFDQSGYVDVPDVLMVLGEYGCTENCITDLDNSGTVQTPDLLNVLSVLWETCE